MIALLILDGLGRAAAEHPRGALALVLVALFFAGQGWLALGVVVAMYVAGRVADRVDARRARRRYGLDPWGRR